jgi:GNAT superfamily N-acetyltransferase
MSAERVVAGVDIVPFRAEHARAFYILNRAWLDLHELYEPVDEIQMADPVRAIIDVGGAIFVAVDRGEVVGTAAILPHGPGEMELAKLTVAAAARGQGLGRRLAEACVDFARRAGVERVILVSSSRLRTALELYESLGFVHRPLPADLPYASADVYMELSVGAWKNGEP